MESQETGIIHSPRHKLSEMEQMGSILAKSGLFGIKDPVQAVALMLLAQAEDRHPASVAKEYDIIQGRPALKAKAKLARFQQCGGKFRWLERSDTVCSAEFSHPACPDPVTITWTMADAKTAGLGQKDNWRKYPRQMLSARVISEGVDATYPDAGSLMYVPEEVMDFDTSGFNPSPVSTPPRKKRDSVIPWDRFVTENGADEDQVLSFVCQRRDATGKTTEQIQDAARKNPDKFWKVYSDWLTTQIPEVMAEEVENTKEVFEGNVTRIIDLHTGEAEEIKNEDQ